MAPQRAEKRLSIGFVERILLVSFLPAHQVVAAVFAAHLPATRVATKECDIAAIRDVGLEMIAHRRRPVLVVTDAENELVVLEDLGMKLKVAVNGVVDLVTGPLGPTDKGKFPVSVDPAKGPLERDPPAQLIARFVLLVPVRRPPIGVEAEAAKAVVGIVGVSRELEKNFGLAAGMR